VLVILEPDDRPLFKLNLNPCEPSFDDDGLVLFGGPSPT
jgi:hypothetical protein